MEGIQILTSQAVEIQKLDIGPVDKLEKMSKIQLEFMYGYTDFFKVVMSQLWGNEKRQEDLRERIRSYIKECIEINSEFSSKGIKNVIRGIHKTHKGCKFRWKDEDIV